MDRPGPPELGRVPKIALEYDPAAINYLPADGNPLLSPTVGFVTATTGEQLIVLKGYVTHDQDTGGPRINQEPTLLVYSESEWRAFVLGVTDEQFDRRSRISPFSMVPVFVRDSKDPTGPVLAFAPDDFDRFLDAMKSEKYHLPTK